MSNVPKLRFKEFSGEWEEKRVGEISKTIIAGGTPSTLKAEYWNGEIRWMSSGELNYKRVYEVNGRVTDIGLKKSSTKMIPIGCILIGLAGQGKTRGTVAMNMVELCTNQSIASIFPNDKIFNNNFLYHDLDRRYDELRKLSTGDGGRGGLNLQIIKSLSINLPTLEEQQKIASFLSAVDTKIDQLTRKKELFEQYKKGVMQKIFSQEVRFKADEENREAKDNCLSLVGSHDDCDVASATARRQSEFPEWEEKKLGEITKKISIKNKDNQNLPVYSISNKHGFIPQGEQFEGVDSSSRNYDISMYKIVGKNTFAYNPARINVGSIGYSGDLENIIISSLYVCFQTIKQINDTFFLQYLETFEFKKQVIRNTEGGVRDYLFYENFSNIKTKLPSYEEQTKIANFLSAIDTKIDLVTKQLDEAKNFKKGLLQQMFV